MSDLYTIDPMLAKDAHIDRCALLKRFTTNPSNNQKHSGTKSHSAWSGLKRRPKSKMSATNWKMFTSVGSEDGELNASVNCLDRHLTLRGDKTALLFEPDAPDAPSSRITYRELYERVCQLGNALRHLGIEKGDRVTIYLPMIPDAVVAILACARIGAIHSVVFGGFAANSIADRVNDCGSKLIITADEGLRGGRKIPLKANVDAALKIHGTQSVETVLVVRHTGSTINMHTPRDRWFHDLVDIQATECAPERMNAEDSLFILYTSGSTGKPKGVLHTTGGYLVYTSYTHETVFDLRENDIYWCTADIGWITGHSYIVYGPLANGTTVLLFEGTPHYPTVSRFWEVIDKHHVTLFYTAPTAIRALMRRRRHSCKKTSRKSLRLLGSVGEPINPEAWHWYYTIVGNGRCPIVDTWWQTETGGILITPLIGATDLKPGSVTLPFFGIRPALVDTNGQTLDGPAAGNLVLLDSWPGQMRTLYGDHQRFIDTYFRTYPNTYFTGDGCRRDADGYYWITGRVDDVINISGHRIGTAEIESTLVAHPKVAEAAVVGFPHPIKGQRHLRIRDINYRRDTQRSTAPRTAHLGTQRNRSNRHTRSRAMGIQPPQNPLRKDHAPHPAQNCRKRTRPTR